MKKKKKKRKEIKKKKKKQEWNNFSPTQDIFLLALSHNFSLMPP